MPSPHVLHLDVLYFVIQLKSLSDPNITSLVKGRVKLALDRLEDLKTLKKQSKKKQGSDLLDLPVAPSFDPAGRGEVSLY